MTGADRYSRVVLWLKVSLPLAALAILSTLFFVAETLDPNAAIPYAEVDVAKILRDQGATSPNFGGVTSDGVKISLSAQSIRPDGLQTTVWNGTDLKARLEMPSGTEILIDSPEGAVDTAAREAVLEGGAELTSSIGYEVTADRISTSLADVSVIADAGIVATGPPGRITADTMALKRMDSDASKHHLVFRQNVRLVFTPTQ
ncbi:MAG: hypothetical protein AAF668_11415 [Pseudomonadota bacterium]